MHPEQPVHETGVANSRACCMRARVLTPTSIPEQCQLHSSIIPGTFGRRWQEAVLLTSTLGLTCEDKPEMSSNKWLTQPLKDKPNSKRLQLTQEKLEHWPFVIKRNKCPCGHKREPLSKPDHLNSEGRALHGLSASFAL